MAKTPEQLALHENILRQKARATRFKKPLVHRLSLYDMLTFTDEIGEELGQIEYMGDARGGARRAMAEFLGDEDEAAELMMAFSILGEDVEKFRNDINELFGYGADEYAEDDSDVRAYDDFLAGIRATIANGGTMLGFDDYQGDYFGLDEWETDSAVQEAQKRLERFTKKQLIEQAQKAFNVAFSYLMIENRWNRLKDVLDLIRGEWGGWLEEASALEQEYEKQMKEDELYRKWYRFDQLTRSLPDTVWLE